MQNAKRTDAYFCGEHNKFIQVAENHARNEKTQLMHCPCNAFKNLRVFSDPTTIRSHVMVSDFVKDYTIWKEHGETDAPPPADNPLDRIVQDEDFDRMVHYYFYGGIDDDGVDDDDDDDRVGVSHGDDVDCPMNGDSSDDELDVVIFSASCCATPKRRYWLLVPGVSKLRDGEKIIRGTYL